MSEENMQQETPTTETPAAPAVMTDGEMQVFIGDMAFQAQHALGKENWEEEVSQITARVIDKARSPMDVRAFVGAGLAFDGDMVKNYIVANGDPNDLINTAFGAIVIDPTDMLIDYILHNSEERPQFVQMVLPHFIRIVPHLDPRELIDWALEVGNTDVMLAVAVNYPLVIGGYQDVMNDIVHYVMHSGKWSEIASLFTCMPGLIAVYDEEYQVQKRLSDDSEENSSEVMGFVNGVYSAFPDDIRIHTSIMAACKNELVNKAFADIATRTFLDMVGGGEPDIGFPECGDDCGHEHHDHEEDGVEGDALCENGCVSTDECLSPEDCGHEMGDMNEVDETSEEETRH
jgi:hypothetical protein